ncbi:MAG: DNA polymerase I [Candidatus Omnitrophota bacterium]
MAESRLFLIDATAFCYRAFYAIKALSTSSGQPTNAIYGFINILNKILKEKKPELLAICFDVSRDTFRAKKFAEYKIQRPPMPDELSGQIPIIKNIISAYGIAIVEREGYEADDIIATLTERAREKNIPVTIVSSDKDMLQLVDDGIAVFSPYKDEGTAYDKKKVSERFGIGPEKITDLIALMGDSADNIPSVPGIGEKTAVSLIGEFGSVDGLLNNISNIKPEKIRIAVNDNIGVIKLNKELATLDRNISLDFDPDKLKIGEPDRRELFRLFKSLEFKKLLKELDVAEDRSPDMKIVVLEDKELKEALRPQDELILYGGSLSDLAFYAKERFFRVKDPGINLKGILSDPGIRKIGHDLKGLKVSLLKGGIALEGLYFDTMIAAYLINPSKSGYTLNDLALDYLGRLLKPGSVDSMDAVGIINQLRPKLEGELSDKLLLDLFTGIEMPLVSVLAAMESTGIRIDLEMLNKLSRDLENRLIGLVEDIYTASGSQFNINSPKQLRDILFERLKLPVIKRSKTGPSTDEEVLRKLADKHKLPAMLLEYRQLMKLKSTYIDSLPNLIDQKTGRIHASFNQTATETGRLSSSAPNLQNLPVKTELGRNIRRAVIAFDEDSYILACDYSQVELRILAHLSKDKDMISAFHEGRDIHKITASLVYGLEEKDISDSMRETAKRVNFGIIYGLTSFGLSRDLGIGVDEAQIFIDAYFLRYPQVKDYLQGQIRFAREEGFVTTMLGRRRYIPEIKSKNPGIRQFAERQAINTPIQGSASDLIKLAMITIHEEIKSRNLKSAMIIQVHDELVFDMPAEEEGEFIGLVMRGMEEVMKLDVPLKVDIKKGRNWSEMKGVK